MQIRKVEPKDIDTVAHIWKHFVEKNLDKNKVRQNYFQNSDLWYVLDNNENSFVPEIQAFVSASAAPGVGHISGIAAVTEAKGFGSKILKHVEGEFVKRGCEKARLYVRKSNFKAQRFYDKNGYEIIDVVHNYYVDDLEDAYLLEKVLKRPK